MTWKGPVKPKQFDLPEDLYQRFKGTAALRGQNVKTAIVEALELYLDRDSQGSPSAGGSLKETEGLRPDQQELIAAYVAMLRDAHSAATHVESVLKIYGYLPDEEGPAKPKRRAR